MTRNSVHTKKDGCAVLRVESVPFSDIPGQSPLFIQYQNDPVSLKRYYPAAIEDHTKITGRSSQVLENYTVDRKILCDALLEDNQRFSADKKTLENIDRLRRADCVAVVTGQQAGLFTGPMYTVYKALSAVKMAECLQGRGINAVPVFWVASEDHDFAEVSKTFVLDSGKSLQTITNLPPDGDKGFPVGAVRLDDSIDDTLDRFFSTIRHTQFTPEVQSIFSDAWRPGMTYSDAFAALIARLFRDSGLVLIDPLSQQLKRLAAPIYSLAIARSREINDGLIFRGKELDSERFHAQVKVDESYFPLFWHDEDGRRQALKFTTRGTVVTKNKSREFKLNDLCDAAEDQPQRFSPSVVLRPVVQDYLLPTICYFGGSAEIAYFAQNSVVYRDLDRPSTTILHRQSFTILEADSQRIMSALDVEYRDLFAGPDALKFKFAKEHLSGDSGRLFSEVEERINIELNRLDQHIASADPTISRNLANRRRKMLYHIAALRDKFYRSQAAKDETLDNRVDRLFADVLPTNQLQERVLNIGYFLNRYGPNFTKWIYDSIDLDDRGHRVIYL